MAAPTLITFVAGQPALAEDVNDNFDAIAGKFNGGIADSDISDIAKIKGYKLSSASGEQVPEDRLANNAVSARVLQSDATAGAPLAAVATANHIKDGIITAAKLAPGVGGGAGLVALTLPGGSGPLGIWLTGLTTANSYGVVSVYAIDRLTTIVPRAELWSGAWGVTCDINLPAGAIGLLHYPKT